MILSAAILATGVSRTAGGATEAPESYPAQEAATAEGPTSQQSSALLPAASPPDERDRLFRLIGSALAGASTAGSLGVIDRYGNTGFGSYSYSNYWSSSFSTAASVGLLGSLSWFPTRYFGMTALLGSLTGLEFEIPINPYSKNWEIAFLVGGAFPVLIPQLTRLLIGGRLTYNFDPQWGLTGALRGTPVPDPAFTAVILEVGISLKI